MDNDQELQKKIDKVGEEDTTTKPRLSISTSPSSSPSREFSFTISLHPSSGGSNITNSFAIDLSPADEIFFHGHLLPLHLISHLPVSSDSSLENFNLLMKDLSEDHKQNDCKDEDNNDMMRGRCNTTTNTTTNNIQDSKKGGKRGTFKIKLSSFLFTKWRKGSAEAGERKEEVKKNKVRLFEMSNVVKRYLKMVQPNLFSKGKRENRKLHGRSCSFTESLCLKEKQPWKARRGGLSAPATMQTSPTNSTGNLTTDSLFPSKSGTTMEELQSAIQAAIAHCKNSTAVKIETLNF
ncbi:Bri1 kinase inhibitor [Thalictrum thalictroides]|uniref:Bri1 kinase inhibitor n=1 Tax=Thalictrum thalictroides TaxID=46969 RepID=A0A7J6V1E8_THATH|nr:Bri1 kinase inhibitor [Thalictrum thalictroides]